MFASETSQFQPPPASFKSEPTLHFAQQVVQQQLIELLLRWAATMGVKDLAQLRKKLQLLDENELRVLFEKVSKEKRATEAFHSVFVQNNKNERPQVCDTVKDLPNLRERSNQAPRREIDREIPVERPLFRLFEQADEGQSFSRLTPQYFEEPELFSLLRVPRRRAITVEHAAQTATEIIRRIGDEARSYIDGARRVLVGTQVSDLIALRSHIDQTTGEIRASTNHRINLESISENSCELGRIGQRERSRAQIGLPINRTQQLRTTIDNALVAISFSEDRLAAQGLTTEEEMGILPHLAVLRARKSDLALLRIENGEIDQAEGTIESDFRYLQAA